LDTWERETERYGGDDGIVLSEQIFCAGVATATAI